jgi:hypothetical protein
MKNIWYVCFCPSDRLGIASLFVKPEFGHVYCFSQGSRLTTIINFDGSRVIVKEHSLSALDLAVGLVAEGSQVLQVVFESEEDEPAVSRGLLYCVSVVKSILGLKNCYAYTPYGLYRWILNSSMKVSNINEYVEMD